MKTENMVDKDQLIRQLEDEFWDERKNHNAHAKLLFGEIVTLKEENTLLREHLKWLIDTVEREGVIDSVTHEGMIEDCKNVLNKLNP